MKETEHIHVKRRLFYPRCQFEQVLWTFWLGLYYYYFYKYRLVYIQ